MALAIVLLLAALSCVHTASLPPHALDTIGQDSLEVDSISADRIRQTVLEGVKQLLDFQLAALKGIPRKRKDIPNILRPRPIQSLKENIDQEPQIKKEDLQKSEPVKVLTDESVQDPKETAIKQVLDVLFNEKKEKLNEETDDVNSDDNIIMLDSIPRSIQNNNDKTVNTDVEIKQTGNKHESSVKDNQIEILRDILQDNVNTDPQEVSSSLSSEDDNNRSKSINNRDINSKTKLPHSELGKQRGPHIIYISNKQSNLDDAIIDTKTLGSNILTSNQDKYEHSHGLKKHIDEDNYKSKHFRDDVKVENHEKPSDKVKTAFVKNNISAIEEDLDDYIHIIDGLIEGDEKIKVENKDLKEAYQKNNLKTKNNNNTEDSHVITINKFVNDKNITKDNVNTNIEETNVRDEKDNIPLDNLSVQDNNNLISSDQRFFQENKNDAYPNPKDDINYESDVSDQVVIIGNEEDFTAGSDRKHVMGETDEEETGRKKSNNIIANKIGTDHNTCSVKDIHVPGYKNYNNCKNQLEIDESKLIQKLFKNKEIKKSLTFSLNFTHK